jgi:mycothiol system anti-sigma-R factor
MADCNDTLRELYGYLDGEITDADREHIRHHLDDCSPCLEAFDFEAELRMVVRNRCVDQVPDDLRERIARAIQAEG